MPRCRDTARPRDDFGTLRKCGMTIIGARDNVGGERARPRVHRLLLQCIPRFNQKCTEKRCREVKKMNRYKISCASIKLDRGLSWKIWRVARKAGFTDSGVRRKDVESIQ